MSRRTCKVYAIVIALICLYTAAGVFFAEVCFPGALDAGAAEPRTVKMQARQYLGQPSDVSATFSEK